MRDPIDLTGEQEKADRGGKRKAPDIPGGDQRRRRNMQGRRTSAVLLVLMGLNACAIHHPANLDPEPTGISDRSAWEKYYQQRFTMYGRATLPYYL